MTHNQLVTDIQLILTYTNATVFRTRTGRFFCAYCPAESPCFSDPDMLRMHTRAEHSEERITSMEKILRPSYANEVVKIDIDSLICTLCLASIPKWADLFRHLNEMHQVILTEARSKVIPFILKNDYKCGVCHKIFLNYYNLDAHMNKHFQNYKCSECNNTYLSLTRFRIHQKVHFTGQYPCEICGKIYSKEKYKKKHMAYVHKSEAHFKCSYCPQRFSTEYSRHLHVLESHSSKVTLITCELCGKTFDWRPYYYRHIRRYHEADCKYLCRYCTKTFVLKKERKAHEISRHTGAKISVRKDMLAFHDLMKTRSDT